MERYNKHVSKSEKKKNVLISGLIGILIIIILIIIVMMLPKKNTNDNTDKNLNQSSKVMQNLDSNGKNLSNDEDNLNVIVKDENKVSITIKPGTLTSDGAVIVINDTNSNTYSWTPSYKMQQKIDGQWQDMKLKNPENALFPNIEYDNKTGVMEQSLVWSNKYGQIETGEYRIVKESDGIQFYAEFEMK